MSEIKVNKITPRAACGTTQLGDSGDTFTVPAGATISNLGTATGFGGTGVVSWDTGSIKTTGFTAVTGTGYFCNTTGGGFTVTLPLSPSAGDVVGVSDYAKTWDTDNLTLGRNGSNIGGGAANSTISTAGLAVTLVYVDVTKGWIVTDSGNQSDAPGPLFVAATGGCITTCGNFKMHTFLSPATFTVTCAGNATGTNKVDYLVVAGGGGGANQHSGGGGGGGFRSSFPSPGGNVGTHPVTAIGYPIQAGGGGAAGPATPSSGLTGTPGVNSVFDTITSAGGGGGGAVPCVAGAAGGSGGGGGACSAPGGAGNTPPQSSPASPVQGYAGGTGTSHATGGGGGGGGAAAVGANGGPTPVAPSGAGPGGIGAQNNIDTNNYYWSGGGGGGAHNTALTGGTGGTGGGGGGGSASSTGGAGGGTAINSGAAGGGPPGGTGGDGGDNSGGGGGASGCSTTPAGNGGSGVVIIRYKFQ
jgi:hypothetical protein